MVPQIAEQSAAGGSQASRHLRINEFDHLITLTNKLFGMPVLLQLSSGDQQWVRGSGVRARAAGRILEQSASPAIARRKSGYPGPVLINKKGWAGPFAFVAKNDISFSTPEIKGSLYLADKKRHRFTKKNRKLLEDICEMISMELGKQLGEERKAPVVPHQLHSISGQVMLG